MPFQYLILYYKVYQRAIHQLALLLQSKVINDSYKCTCKISTNLTLLHLLIFTSPHPVNSLYLSSLSLSQRHKPSISSLHSSSLFVLPPMARETSASFFAWIMATGLLFQGLVLPAMSIRFEDKKTYYSPNPHSGTPPSGISDSTSSTYTAIFVLYFTYCIYFCNQYCLLSKILHGLD